MYLDIDGREVFASTGGRTFEPARPVIVFLHGSGIDHTFWALYSRYFAFRGYSVLAPDLPGHTRSAGPPLTSIEAMADWLHKVLQAQEAEDLSLVGHSQGCLVALEYGARHKEGLKSISFVASGLATPVNKALLQSAQENPAAAVAMMLAWGFGSAGHLHRGAVPGSSMVANGRRVMTRNAPAALAADLAACNAYANGRRAAAAIECPTQVILAAADRMTPRKSGLELAETLHDTELEIVRDCGHMLPQECPDRCRELLRDFIFHHNPA